MKTKTENQLKIVEDTRKKTKRERENKKEQGKKKVIIGNNK